MENKGSPNKKVELPQRPKNSLPGHLVSRAFVIIFCLTITIIVGVVWITWYSQKKFETLEARHFRITELTGKIIHLDEVLTMSARMAAATGQVEWENRYSKFEPNLDDAIKEAVNLVAVELIEDGMTKTDAANIKLVEMERNAFEFIRRGNLDKASDLLFSTEYEKQKHIYRTGITEITDTIQRLEKDRLIREHTIFFVLIASLIIIIPLIVFIWLVGLRILRRYIKERKKTELALRMSEQCFHAIADYSCSWEIWVNPQGRPVWTNPAAQGVTGYSVKEIMAMQDYPMPLVYKEDHAKVSRAFRSAIKGGRGKEFEFRLCKKDGTVIWVEIAWQPIYDEKGVSIGHRASTRDITKQKQFQNALQQNEEKYKTLVETAPDAVFVADTETGVILDVNKKAEELLGMSSNEIIGLHQTQLHPKEDIEKYRKVFESDIKKGKSITTKELFVCHKDGHKIPVEINSSVTDMGGRKIIHGIFRDITKRKQIETEIASIAKFPSENPNPVFRMSGDCTILYNNKAASALIDTSRCPDADIVLEHLHKYVPKSLKLSEPLRTEITSCDKSYSLTFAPVSDSNYVNVYGLDITERKRATQRLQASEERYRLLVDTMNEGLGVADAKYNFTYVNNRFAQMLGYADEEMLGRNITSFLDEENKKVMKQQIAQRSKGKAKPYDLTWTAKDGRKVHTIVSPKPIFDENGNFAGSFGVLTDITNRKRAEEILQESEEKYRTLLRNIPQKIFYKDLNSKYVLCNDSFAGDLNIKPYEIKGKTDYDFFPPQLSEKYRANDKKIIQSGKTEETEEKYFSGGKELIVHTLKAPIKDVNGNIIGLLGIFWDITEQKHAQYERDRFSRELERKNEELESIIYVASHDLRTPLLNIHGFSHEVLKNYDLLCSELEDKKIYRSLETKTQTALKENIPEYLGYIATSAKKMDALIAGLLQLARLGHAAIKIESLDMNEIMTDVAKGMEYLIKDARIKLDIDPLPSCLGDDSQLNQVFSNLLDNAVKFLDDSRPGKIHIFGKTLDKKSIYCVEDNGKGIAPEYTERIFEVFHQLEPDTKEGQGLGLTIVKRILDGLEGKIWVDSVPGKGSRFYVSLPAE